MPLLLRWGLVAMLHLNRSVGHVLQKQVFGASPKFSKFVHHLYALCVYDVGMKRSNYFLPEPLIEQLKKLATERDVSVSELVRQAIHEFLKRQ